MSCDCVEYVGVCILRGVDIMTVDGLDNKYSIKYNIKQSIKYSIKNCIKYNIKYGISD